MAQLEVALPSLLDNPIGLEQGGFMPRVVIGMDPHKRSVTIEVMTPGETALPAA